MTGADSRTRATGVSRAGVLARVTVATLLVLAAPAVSFPRFPTLKEAETELISKALEMAKGNQGIAASLLGMTRQALNNRLRRNGR